MFEQQTYTHNIGKLGVQTMNIFIEKIIMPDNSSDLLKRKIDRIIVKLVNGDYEPRKLNNGALVYFVSSTERVVIDGTEARIFKDYFSYSEYLESLVH